MTRRRSRWLLAGLVSQTVLVACGGSDVVTGPDGSGGDGGNTPPVANPSFSQDVEPILSAAGCTAGNCHGGGSGGLTLTGSAPTDYANLVGVVSSCGLFQYVNPGDAANSYVVMKLENRNTCGGGRMPLARAALSSNRIGTIRNWIDSGAPNN